MLTRTGSPGDGEPEPDCALQSEACGTAEGFRHLFADIIRRLRSRFFPPPQETKLKGAGLSDSEGGFTLTKEEKHRNLG